VLPAVGRLKLGSLMEIYLANDRRQMGRFVAGRAAADLRTAVSARGQATLVVATGASQFEVLEELVQQANVPWDCIHGFHLDEYLGLSPEHPASFCRYLQTRFVRHVPLASFHYLRGDQPCDVVLQAANRFIAQRIVDVALVGIGENGHLAFNDPPADFVTQTPYLVVPLDLPCRRQQVGEGWFATLEEVPTQAISMSIQQILKSRKIYCSVPDAQKAVAVQATLTQAIGPEIPASILREHHDTCLVIDPQSAALLDPELRSQARRCDDSLL
jgi:glucosamine-6-phosphate deaminase